MEKLQCCICNAEITLRTSHNAEPYAHGRCCLKCNDEYVIPTRMIDIYLFDNDRKKKVKELRDRTGAGMRECKIALIKCDDNVEKAYEWIAKHGLCTKEEK